MSKVYANRELSWLKFNERVLEEAARKDVPLCERLNFISIYQSNLDEFFRVRVGSLVDMMAIDPKKKDNKTNMTAGEQLEAVLEDVRRLDKRKEEIYEFLIDELKEYGIHIMSFGKLSEEEKKKLEKYFDEKVELLLSPHIVGHLQPFPFIRNCEIHAVAALRKKSSPPDSGKLKIGIISCNLNVLPRLIKISDDENRFILIEDLILSCIDRVFKNYKVEARSLVRIVRNADIDADALYDEEIDYREFMSELMKHRRHMAPVRMVVSSKFDTELAAEFCKEVEIDPEAVFTSTKPLDLTFLSVIQKLLRDRTELFYEHRSPQKPADILFNRPIMDQIKEKDKLLCYPYDSMQPFLRMLREASNDPDVLSIKMTLYRVAKNSQVVEHLIEAAENGKDVHVLLELKARFDEENNIAWSQRLEEAGCQVIYGLNGIKVHSKLCLIVRKGKDGPEYISYVGTGNFNEVTARLYTDYGLLTADKDIGQNVAAVFQSLALDETLQESEHLLVAPHCLRRPVINMIEQEIEKIKNGQEAYIGVKINSLTDKDIIDKLIEASKAGVKVDMIIRGICCLNPGIEEKTENIRVISIVGRFLEHSRIYIFGKGAQEKMYISSADFMTRNTERRVEVAVPISDSDIHAKIRSMFNLMLKDNCQAWELQPDGTYVRIKNNEKELNSQELFCKMAYDNANSETSAFSGDKMPLRSGSAGTEDKKAGKGGFFARLFRKIHD
jgi:polyphosphate kinase